MATIPRREDILKKHERGIASELQATNDSLASLLNAAESLPLRIAVKGLGSTEAVREAIIARLKQQGWSVVRVNPDNRESDYEIR